MLKIEAIRPNGNIYITGQTDLKSEGIVHEVMSDTESSLVFIERTNIEGIFKYGIKQLFDDGEHGHGYIWHSRASVMNQYFGCALIDIYYRKEGNLPYQTCSIDLAHLEPLLEGTGYIIDWAPCEITDIDVKYRVIKEKDNDAY